MLCVVICLCSKCCKPAALEYPCFITSYAPAVPKFEATRSTAAVVTSFGSQGTNHKTGFKIEPCSFPYHLCWPWAS